MPGPAQIKLHFLSRFSIWSKTDPLSPSWPVSGAGNTVLGFANEIEEFPNSNFRDQRSRTHQHDLLEQKIGQSVTVRKGSIWRLVRRMVRPTPVLNQVDATGSQQREKNLKGRLRLLIGVRCIVYHQIELVRKFIPNDILQEFPDWTVMWKSERTDLPCRQHTARAVPQSVH